MPVKSHVDDAIKIHILGLPSLYRAYIVLIVSMI